MMRYSCLAANWLSLPTGLGKDALTGEPVNVPADKLEAVGINNRIRGLRQRDRSAQTPLFRTAESDFAAAKTSHRMTRARKCCRLSKEHWQKNPIHR